MRFCLFPLGHGSVSRTEWQNLNTEHRRLVDRVKLRVKMLKLAAFARQEFLVEGEGRNFYRNVFKCRLDRHVILRSCIILKLLLLSSFTDWFSLVSDRPFLFSKIWFSLSITSCFKSGQSAQSKTFCFVLSFGASQPRLPNSHIRLTGTWVTGSGLRIIDDVALRVLVYCTFSKHPVRPVGFCKSSDH